VLGWKKIKILSKNINMIIENGKFYVKPVIEKKINFGAMTIFIPF